MTIKSLPFSVRLDVKIRDALERAAKDESRSQGNLLEIILAEGLRQRGYLPKENALTRSPKSK
jgi:hypothetical protein